MSVLDRLARVNASRPQGAGQGSRIKGIYHQWKEGVNRLRLAGEFTEVRTHFIAPSPKRKDRGLCQATAFQGDEKIPMVVNCPNWDISLEHMKKDKSCPVCKLNAIAREALKDNPTEEEKKFYEALRGATRATSYLKWNVIDRDDPFVEREENGTTTKVRGFKIASIGPEAANDIFGIYKQVGYDINDPDKGIDIEVIKDSKGPRTTYSARAVVQGTSLKVTPFTDEERQMEMHDLKVRCGKQTDAQKIVDALHEDLREMLELVGADKVGAEDDASVNEELEKAYEEVSAPDAKPEVKPEAKPSKPTVGGNSSVLERLSKKPSVQAPVPSTQEALGDEDSLLDDGSKKN